MAETSDPGNTRPAAAHQSHPAPAVEGRSPSPEQLNAIIAAAGELIGAIEDAPWIAGTAAVPGPTFPMRVWYAILTFERARNPLHHPFDKRAGWVVTAKWPSATRLYDGLRRLYAAHDRILTAWHLEQCCGQPGAVRIIGSGGGPPVQTPPGFIAVDGPWPPKIDPAELQELRDSLAIVMRVRDSAAKPTAAPTALDFEAARKAVKHAIDLLCDAPEEALFNNEPGESTGGCFDIYTVNRLVKAAKIGWPVFAEEPGELRGYGNAPMRRDRWLIVNHPDPNKGPVKWKFWSLHGHEPFKQTKADRTIENLTAWLTAFESAAALAKSDGSEPGAGVDAKGKTAAKLSLQEANLKAREYLRKNLAEARTITVRELATKVGCSTGTIIKTPTWKLLQEERDRERQAKEPSTVSLTPAMQAATGVYDDPLDEVMAEQQADAEPSPLTADPPDYRDEGAPRKVKVYANPRKAKSHGNP